MDPADMELGGLGFLLRIDTGDPVFAGCRCAEERGVLYCKTVTVQDGLKIVEIRWCQVDTCRIGFPDAGSGPQQVCTCSLALRKSIEDIWHIWKFF